MLIKIGLTKKKCLQPGLKSVYHSTILKRWRIPKQRSSQHKRASTIRFQVQLWLDKQTVTPRTNGC